MTYIRYLLNKRWVTDNKTYMINAPDKVTAPIKRMTLGWGWSCFISSYSANRSFLLVSGALSDVKKRVVPMIKTSVWNKWVETYLEKMNTIQFKWYETLLICCVFVRKVVNFYELYYFEPCGNYFKFNFNSFFFQRPNWSSFVKCVSNAPLGILTATVPSPSTNAWATTQNAPLPTYFWMWTCSRGNSQSGISSSKHETLVYMVSCVEFGGTWLTFFCLLSFLFGTRRWVILSGKRGKKITNHLQIEKCWECKSMHKRSCIWTITKNLKAWLIITVIQTT